MIKFNLTYFLLALRIENLIFGSVLLCVAAHKVGLVFCVDNGKPPDSSPSGDLLNT